MNERKVSESARFSEDFPLFIPHHCLGLVSRKNRRSQTWDSLGASTHLKWDRIDRAKVGGGRKEESGRERDMMTGLRVTWWWKDRQWGLPSESNPH